jgi:hypothetical protein
VACLASILPRMVPVWLCDDTTHWHQVSAATVNRLAGFRFRGFYSGASLIMALEEARSAGGLPAILLMDYYLRGERGDRLTRAVRAVPLPERLTIVGYSSISSGSAAIVRAGGDLALPKRDTGDGWNVHLFEYLRQWLCDRPTCRQ